MREREREREKERDRYIKRGRGGGERKRDLSKDVGGCMLDKIKPTKHEPHRGCKREIETETPTHT